MSSREEEDDGRWWVVVGQVGKEGEERRREGLNRWVKKKPWLWRKIAEEERMEI